MRLLHAGIHFYLIDIIVLTLGVTVTILSLLGASPYDSMLVRLNRTFGLTVGSWEIVAGLTLLIFYADFLNFKRTTLSISGLQYVNLPKGPVPENYDILLNLATNTEEVTKSFVELGYDYQGEKFEAKGEVDTPLFTDDEIRTLEDMYEGLSHHNSNTISELLYEENAWNDTDRLDKISYKYASKPSID